ncbi:MAG TPA: DNA polymerase Y family protein [Xanthobacteraceae bacterium]|nr:DNA polymerase Y family protein [Xanthobacteraceae bacterium]
MHASSRRYLSLWLKRLSTDRIARRSSAPDDAPLVVVASVKSALRITAMNNAAARLGLIASMALADARAMYPALAAADADPHADAKLLEAVADWCDRYTPLVGLDAPDGLLLDITGCAHLFGGEAALCRDLIERLARQGLQASVAVADTVGCAWAVARYGRAPIVARGEAHEALAPLPLVALRTDADTVAGLAQVGLQRIADVIDRPRAPLAARYGQIFVRRIDQALGREDEPITPRLPLPAALAERRFPDPIGREEDVLGTIEQLARELDRVLERRGEGARLLQVALFRADGKVHRLELGTAAPLRDPARVRRLFADRLAVLGDECDPGFGFDMLRLSALVTERFDPQQSGLAGGDEDADLAHLIDRLGARFGLRRIARLEPRNTHIPEFAVAAVPAHAGRNPKVRAAEGREPRRATAASFEARLRPAPQNDEHMDSLAPVRPIRLFQRPEQIEAIAEVPDGPPVRFRWRRVLHEVARVEGPERIAMEWWRDAQGNKLTRDYFRVESRDGARMWLYREGLFEREIGQPENPDKPTWYLHGLFA